MRCRQTIPLSTRQESARGWFGDFEESELLPENRLESLRQHLIDMDNVTLRAEVQSVDVDGGVRFDVTSDIPAVAASIRRMVYAHAATMDGVQGWALHANDLSNGANLTVLGDDRERILGLGLIGMMALGMHHQAHHLALATGHSPH